MAAGKRFPLWRLSLSSSRGCVGLRACNWARMDEDTLVGAYIAASEADELALAVKQDPAATGGKGGGADTRKVTSPGTVKLAARDLPVRGTAGTAVSVVQLAPGLFVEGVQMVPAAGPQAARSL